MDDLHRSRPFLGIALKLASTATVSIGLVLVKFVSARYPVGEIVFMRGLFGLIPLFGWLIWTRQVRGVFRTHRLPVHFGRSVIGVTAMGFQFASVGLMPLADASAIMQASPLFVVALAALVLGEKVRLVRWTAVIAGLCGMLIIVFNYAGFRMGGGEYSLLGVACASLAAVFIALAAITVRSMTGIEPVGTIVLYFSIFMMLLMLLTIPFGGWKMPGPLDFLLLAGVGLSAGSAQLLLTLALRYADASLIGPFEYTNLVWALFFGVIFFHHLPDGLVLIGAAIIVAAGLGVFFREQQLRSRKDR